MKAIILAFLMQLDAIGTIDPAVYDLPILAAVDRPIHEALIDGRTDVTVPRSFGMPTPSEDMRLHDAIDIFIRDMRKSPEFTAAKTPEARIELLYAEGNETPRGHGYDDFFAFSAGVK